MKKTVSGGVIDFSYSRMGMYLECPKKYEFRYIYRLPEKPKSYFAFGHCVHGSLEYLYSVSAPPFPSLEDILQHFTSAWDKTSPEGKGYTARQITDGKPKRDYNDGLDMLGRYYAKHKDSFHVPLSAEFKTKVEVDGLNVIMIADRIDYLGDGKIAVVDYKTGKNVERVPDQLYMYQKLLDLSPDLQKLASAKTGEKGPFTVGKMLFYHVPSLEETYFDRADDAALSKVWDKALDVADHVRRRDFPATPGETKCRFCDFRDRCQAGNQGYSAPSEAFEAAPAPAPKPSADILAGKIDKCGQLCEQVKKISEEADGLKREIIALMRDRGLNLHFGEKFRANLAKSRKLEITDEKALMAALRETGLLQRASAPTRTTVEKLLLAADVSEEHRKQLSKHASSKEEFRVDFSKITD